MVEPVPFLKAIESRDCMEKKIGESVSEDFHSQDLPLVPFGQQTDTTVPLKAFSVQL